MDFTAGSPHLWRMDDDLLELPAKPLVDRFGRTINYLRVSVTDRCDFRCVYCMAETMTFRPKAEVLSLDEIDRLASAFVRRGTRKLRLTGGEPLVRHGIVGLVHALGRHLATGALDELTMTTNGAQLRRFAADLHAAGMRRINVSLDTLDPVKFAQVTRWGQLAKVLDGIAAARDAGLAVRINMVVLDGVNDGEIDAMLRWCAAEGHDLVLIEAMPMGAVDGDRTTLSLAAVRRDLATRMTLVDLPDATGGPARYVRVAETGQRLGFITPLTHDFCAGCNRVRLTATGILYLCLGQDDAADLRAVLRASRDDAALDAAIDAAVSRKPWGHDFAVAGPARHMSVTGG